MAGFTPASFFLKDSTMTKPIFTKYMARQWAKSEQALISEVERIDASKNLISRLVDWIKPEFEPTKTRIFLFASMMHEPSVMDLMAALPDFSFALPRVRTSIDMEFREFKKGDPLAQGRLQILEPTTSAKTVMPSQTDVVLIPGLCFRADGYRIGHGKGYYDRHLGQLKSKPIFTGTTFHRFVTENFSWQAESHDVRMDVLVTEQKWIRVI